MRMRFFRSPPSVAGSRRSRASCRARAEVRNEHTLRDTSARSSHGSLAHSVRASSLRALLRFFTLVATLFAQPAVAQDLRGIRRDDVVVRFLPGEAALARAILRSEEHTSELQSRE